MYHFLIQEISTSNSKIMAKVNKTDAKDWTKEEREVLREYDRTIIGLLSSITEEEIAKLSPYDRINYALQIMVILMDRNKMPIPLHLKAEYHGGCD